MAPTSKKTTSSLARALAGMTESVSIPKPRNAATDADTAPIRTRAGSRANVNNAAAATAAAAAAATTTSMASKKHKNSGLPTPPHSISPNLPPQVDHNNALADDKDRASHEPPTPPPAPSHIDSDIDLEDAVEHAQALDARHRGLTARHLRDGESPDAHGDITPTLLATHHLPAILLDNGPLAIRHVMGYLTTSVPGFAGIPPAKARRLVVAALEGRGPHGQAGGLNPAVRFDKVGWGRWDARKCSESARPMHATTPHSVIPAISSIPRGLQIPRSHQAPPSSSLSRPSGDRTAYLMRYGSQISDASYGHGHDDNASSVCDHDASRMALDPLPRAGSASYDADAICISPPLGPRTPALDDLEDATDEEDWASMGAAALRNGSVPHSGSLLSQHRKRHPSLASSVDPKNRGRGVTKRPSAYFTKSAPLGSSLHGGSYSRSLQKVSSVAALRHDSPLRSVSREPPPVRRVSHQHPQPVGIASQDRDAIEALLQLSAV